MSPIIGIGGIFFKSKNPKDLQKWYIENLGLQPDNEGYIIFRPGGADEPGYTLWAPFPADTKYFAPSDATFMINFRVTGLDSFVKQLKQRGVTVHERIEVTPEGRFTWIMDPEGNRVELWEPPQT